MTLPGFGGGVGGGFLSNLFPLLELSPNFLSLWRLPPPCPRRIETRVLESLPYHESSSESHLPFSYMMCSLRFECRAIPFSDEIVVRFCLPVDLDTPVSPLTQWTRSLPPLRQMVSPCHGQNSFLISFVSTGFSCSSLRPFFNLSYCGRSHPQSTPHTPLHETHIASPYIPCTLIHFSTQITPPPPSVRTP